MVKGSRDSIKSCNFKSVLKRIGLLITSAMSTTATKTILAMRNWLPVEQLERLLALYAEIRLNAGHSWNSRPYGHVRILNLVDVIPKLIDYRMPTPLFSRYFTHSTEIQI